jgi:hypothetical protein
MPLTGGMMTQVTTFEDGVKERLKSIVAELIPEDRWTTIVRTTIAEFEKVDLPRLVKSELTEVYKKEIAKEFSKPEWQATFTDHGTQTASALVQKLVIDSAPLVLAAIMGDEAQRVMENIRYQIQTRQGYR